MKIGVIVNPISGAGAHRDAGRARVELAARVLREAGADPAVTISERIGHAPELTRALVADGAQRVIAWGGDGTINEVGSVLAGGRVPLGIVPSGSGNGLATELGVALDAVEALRRAIRGEARPIDAGNINGRFFFNIAGIGFDARIAHEFHALPPGRRGGLPYLRIGLRAIWTYRAETYRIRLDGAERVQRALMVVFANARQYGNGAIIAPRARLDDGLLDAVVADDRSIPAHLWRLRHLFRGTSDRAEGVTTQTVARALVECDRPLAMHVDGEPIPPALAARVDIRPGALLVAY